MHCRHATGLKGSAGNQHGGVFIDLRQVLRQLVQSPLFLEIVIIDRPHGVVTIALLGIEVAVVVKPLATGDRLCPQLPDEPRLGNVLLALVTIEEEQHVVVEALLGLPFQFPGVSQQVREQGMRVKGMAKLLTMIAGRLVVDVAGIELGVAQFHPDHLQAAIALERRLNQVTQALVVGPAVAPVAIALVGKIPQLGRRLPGPQASVKVDNNPLCHLTAQRLHFGYRHGAIFFK